MMSRVSIRTRLTAVSAAVALVLLAAAMTTVYLLQERDEQARLTAAARVAAGGLAQVGEADESGDGGDEGAPGQITTYLEHRAASPTLLLVRNPEGAVITSSAEAKQLSHYLGLPSGSHRDVTISGQRYVVATTHRPDGLVAVAAIPRSETEAQITRLLRGMLTVGAVACYRRCCSRGWPPAERGTTQPDRRAHLADHRRRHVRASRPGGDA